MTMKNEKHNAHMRVISNLLTEPGQSSPKLSQSPTGQPEAL